jgi:hypothetical protein
MQARIGGTSAHSQCSAFASCGPELEPTWLGSLAAQVRANRDVVGLLLLWKGTGAALPVSGRWCERREEEDRAAVQRAQCAES